MHAVPAAGLAAGTVLTDTATVGSPTPDPAPANGTATATTTVGAGSADLAVTKTGTATATPGQPVSYTVTVHNNGPSDATGVVLTDTPGPGLIGVTAAGCTGAPADLPDRCARGRRDRHRDGYRRPWTPAFTGPSTQDTAVVSSGTADPVPGNDSATATTTVGAAERRPGRHEDRPGDRGPGRRPELHRDGAQQRAVRPRLGVTVTDTPGAGILAVEHRRLRGSDRSARSAPSSPVPTPRSTVTATADPALADGTVLTNTATVDGGHRGSRAGQQLRLGHDDRRRGVGGPGGDEDRYRRRWSPGER